MNSLWGLYTFEPGTFKATFPYFVLPHMFALAEDALNQKGIYKDTHIHIHRETIGCIEGIHCFKLQDDCCIS